MANASQIRTSDLGLADRIAVSFKSVAERFAKYRLYRETLNEMAVLSDRELSDLGLHRSHIKSIALEHVYDAK